MRYSIATVSISGTLSDKIEAIAAAGFTGIEIFENDLISHVGSLVDLRKKMTDLGLTVEVYQPFRDFEGMPEPFRSRNFDRAERKFDLMEELGTELLMICSMSHPMRWAVSDGPQKTFRTWRSRCQTRHPDCV